MRRTHFLLAAVGVPAALSLRRVVREKDEDTAACKAGSLTNETWISAGVDDLLAQAAHNYTTSPYGDNVQALADYLGAPNFVCGIDQFCNAGQPCSPVDLPGWYVLMAMQTWNSYVNSLNTAIMYTTSILSMRLPALVNDLWPAPKDSVTPTKSLMGYINGVINAVPITGLFGAPFGMMGAAVQGGNIIASNAIFPPPATLKYIRWSQLSRDMAEFVDGYKHAVNDYANQVIGAPIDDPKRGISTVLQGGRYLGQSRNFTQQDLESSIFRSIEVNAISLILQAQNFYIVRVFNMLSCSEFDNSEYCLQQDDGRTYTNWRLYKKGATNGHLQSKTADKLVNTYHLKKVDFLKGPTECYEQNDYTQLTNPWDAAGQNGLVVDPLQTCNFNLLVCDIDSSEGYVEWRQIDERCEKQGAKFI